MLDKGKKPCIIETHAYDDDTLTTWDIYNNLGLYNV